MTEIRAVVLVIAAFLLVCGPAWGAAGDVESADVAAGGTVVYTLRVANLGRTQARNTVVIDHLHKLATFVSASPSVCSGADTVLTCRLGHLAGTGRRSVDVTLRIKPDAPAGAVLRLPGHARTDTTEFRSDNNDDEITLRVFTKTDLSVSKEGPRTLTPGGKATYTLTVHNGGPSAATDVLLTDRLGTHLTATRPLPAGCAVEGGDVLCRIDRLGPDATRRYTITAGVSPSASGRITNTATVGSDTATTTGTATATSLVDGKVQAGPELPFTGPVLLRLFLSLSLTLIVGGALLIAYVRLADYHL